MAKTKTGKRRVTFSYAAPDAETVVLAGDFTGWQQAPLSLKRDKNGLWTKTVLLPPGRHEYRLLVNGEWRDDPKCSTRLPNQFGTENCVCIVAESAGT